MWQCPGLGRHTNGRITDEGATLDDLREAVETLADAERIARRVFGGAHPLTVHIERHLRLAQAALHVRESPNT